VTVLEFITTTEHTISPQHPDCSD